MDRARHAMMTGVAKKKSSEAPWWAVTVRLANGSTRYYAAQSARQGQQEWSTRKNQAHGFATKEEATAFATSCDRNGDAKEYAVVLVRA